MAFEIKETFQIDDGTVRKPVWEVFDQLNGTSEWNITRATFALRHVNSGEIIASGDSNNAGEMVINNDDEDRAGNTIKTVQPTINLTGTEAMRGAHKLTFHIYLDTGEDFVVRSPVRIEAFEEVP